MTNTQNADAKGVDRKDVYTKVTERIISDLEQGIRPWMKPWSAEHAAGRITKPAWTQLTPLNSSIPHKKVTAASLLPPDRGLQTD